MSDATPFGFGKFVPGFDFLQSLSKGSSSGVPALPQLSNWVAPTLSVEELEKRIEELKAVQFWLEQNSRALTATVQALEVQKMTLATLQGMNVSMGDLANAFKLRPAEGPMAGASAASPNPFSATAGQPREKSQAMQPHAAPPAPAQTSASHDGESRTQATSSPKARSGKPEVSPAGAGVIDPMQWWGALTQQFQEIAASALKDAAQQTTLDTPRAMAASMTQDALKAATQLAETMALQGGKIQAASRAKSGKSVKSAPAPTAKNATSRKPATTKKASPRSAAAKAVPPTAAARKRAS